MSHQWYCWLLLCVAGLAQESTLAPAAPDPPAPVDEVYKQSKFRYARFDQRKPTASEPRLELVVQTGHTYYVTGVARSSDGKHVLTGSEDKTAILWEAASGKKLQTFNGHTEAVWSVALSGDGKFVLTGSRDSTAILWGAARGKKLQTFLGHTDGVTSVALSGDGKPCSHRVHDNKAILWEAAGGKKLQTFQGHTREITSVALSGDGKLVVTGLLTTRRSCGRRPAVRNSRPSGGIPTLSGAWP